VLLHFREETTWKTRHRWRDNIKANLKEFGSKGMGWVEDRIQWFDLLNTIIKLWVP
jgi:hypothetical protein